MSNLSVALSLILAVETPNMNCKAVGDLHLPVARRAFGRMQIRRTVLDDLTAWDKSVIVWNRADSQNPELDVLMAQRWLRHYCGKSATVKTYLTTWNGGKSGRNTPQALNYYKRAMAIKLLWPSHYSECKKEVERVL